MSERTAEIAHHIATISDAHDDDREFIRSVMTIVKQHLREAQEEMRERCVQAVDAVRTSHPPGASGRPMGWRGACESAVAAIKRLEVE